MQTMKWALIAVLGTGLVACIEGKAEIGEDDTGSSDGDTDADTDADTDTDCGTTMGFVSGVVSGPEGQGPNGDANVWAWMESGDQVEGEVSSDGTYELNVEGGRDREERRERRDRDDRRGDRRSDRDMDKLKKLARRLAEEAVRTGESVRIRRELNSFERRTVHVTLADFEGVKTQSEGEGHHKTVAIIPVGGGEE